MSPEIQLLEQYFEEYLNTDRKVDGTTWLWQLRDQLHRMKDKTLAEVEAYWLLDRWMLSGQPHAKYCEQDYAVRMFSRIRRMGPSTALGRMGMHAVPIHSNIYLDRRNRLE